MKTKKMTANKRIKGCGDPYCKQCRQLKGYGPWCPRCGASRYSTHKGLPLHVAWTPTVCMKCTVEMKRSGKPYF